MNRFRLGQCSVPDGKSGDWTVSTFELTEKDVALDNLSFTFAGQGWMCCRAGVYRKLTCKGRGVIMSNTPMEVRTNYDAYRLATGRVLINGLGLGMLLEGILSKPDVTYVRVIEFEEDVIKLVGPTYLKDKRVEIIHADAYFYSPAKGEKFDYVWHDIWDTINGENLPLMAKLTRRYGRRAEKQGVWSRDMIRADARRYG